MATTLSFCYIELVSHPKSRKIFSKIELAKAQMELIEKKYGILPDEVNEEGYYYDGVAILKAVKKETNKKLKQKF